MEIQSTVPCCGNNRTNRQTKQNTTQNFGAIHITGALPQDLRHITTHCRDVANCELWSGKNPLEYISLTEHNSPEERKVIKNIETAIELGHTGNNVKINAIPNDEAEVAQFADEINFPCILKPYFSHLWRKHGKKKKPFKEKGYLCASAEYCCLQGQDAFNVYSCIKCKGVVHKSCAVNEFHEDPALRKRIELVCIKCVVKAGICCARGESPGRAESQERS